MASALAQACSVDLGLCPSGIQGQGLVWGPGAKPPKPGGNCTITLAIFRSRFDYLTFFELSDYFIHLCLLAI